MKKFIEFLKWPLPLILLVIGIFLVFLGVGLDESLKKVYNTVPVYAIGILFIAYYCVAWVLGWLTNKDKN